MSHFTVLVIGENPEDQLQPYHEFECTGIDDQYIQDVDITSEVMEDGLDYHGLEDRTVSNESEIDKSETHKYGYAIVQNGELVKAIRRTNPNRKWDWYQLGGRWTGHFKVKDATYSSVGERSFFGRPAKDGHADQTTKGNVDFDFMRDVAAKEAGRQYDKLHSIVRGREIPAWSEIRERHPNNIDAARKEYRENQVILDINSDQELKDMFLWGDEPSRFAETRADFVQKARNKAVTTYAYIYNGEWHGKAEMGWFGISHDEMNEDTWEKEYSDLLDSLPDDTLLSVYDCHI
jgi:hypothetical protein